MTGNPDYVGRWYGELRFAFGFRDDAGYRHQYGEGVPKRSIIDKDKIDYATFRQTFKNFYLKRIKQILRHFEAKFGTAGGGI